MPKRRLYEHGVVQKMRGESREESADAVWVLGVAMRDGGVFDKLGVAAALRLSSVSKDFRAWSRCWLELNAYMRVPLAPSAFSSFPNPRRVVITRAHRVTPDVTAEAEAETGGGAGAGVGLSASEIESRALYRGALEAMPRGVTHLKIPSDIVLELEPPEKYANLTHLSDHPPCNLKPGAVRGSVTMGSPPPRLRSIDLRHVTLRAPSPLEGLTSITVYADRQCLAVGGLPSTLRSLTLHGCGQHAKYRRGHTAVIFTLSTDAPRGLVKLRVVRGLVTQSLHMFPPGVETLELFQACWTPGNPPDQNELPPLARLFPNLKRLRTDAAFSSSDIAQLPPGISVLECDLLDGLPDAVPFSESIGELALISSPRLPRLPPMPNLRALEIRAYRGGADHPLPFETLPPGLRKLAVPGFPNWDGGAALPNGLRFLTLGDCFTSGIGTLPPGLESLELGHSFCGQLPTSLPENLRNLHIKGPFRHALPCFPPRLERLVLPARYSYLTTRLPRQVATYVALPGERNCTLRVLSKAYERNEGGGGETPSCEYGKGVGFSAVPPSAPVRVICKTDGHTRAKQTVLSSPPFSQTFVKK